jgi:anti-sigma B factor antagonist
LYILIAVRRLVMELKVVREDYDMIHIALSGKLDVPGEAAIGPEFRALTKDRGKATLVDMTEVTYLASLGIRLLFEVAKSLAAQKKKLVIYNPQPMVEEILLTSGTAKIIPIARDMSDIMQHLS